MNIKKMYQFVRPGTHMHNIYGPLINSTFDIKLLIINWSSQNELQSDNILLKMMDKIHVTKQLP